jgi:hypothetical protein
MNRGAGKPPIARGLDEVAGVIRRLVRIQGDDERPHRRCRPPPVLFATSAAEYGDTNGFWHRRLDERQQQQN